MSDAETQAPEQPKIDKIGFDNLLEDLFGLNIRGLKSIWVLFKSPRDYFAAAKTVDWFNKYTPSFRIWFAIAAITAALKFIWASDTGAMTDMYAGQFSEMAEQFQAEALKSGKDVDFSEFDPRLAATTLIKWLFVIVPFATIPLMALLAIVYRAWGEKLSYVVRFRYLFALTITANAISLVTAPLMVILPEKHMMTYSLAAMLFMVVLFFLTAFFGPYAKHNIGSRIALSGLISTLLFVLTMISMVIAIMVGMVPTMMSTFPNMS